MSPRVKKWIGIALIALASVIAMFDSTQDSRPLNRVEQAEQAGGQMGKGLFILLFGGVGIYLVWTARKTNKTN